MGNRPFKRKRRGGKGTPRGRSRRELQGALRDISGARKVLAGDAGGGMGASPGGENSRTTYPCTESHGKILL